MKECYCANIKKEDWDDKVLNWSGAFLGIRIPMFLHNPINFSQKVEQLKDKIVDKGYEMVTPGQIFTKNGMPFGKIMLEVRKIKQFDPEIITLNKIKVYTLVSDLPFGRLDSAIRKLKRKMGNDEIPGATYFWYTSCPNCVSKKGFETIVFLEAMNI